MSSEIAFASETIYNLLMKAPPASEFNMLLDI
jgi:hypothetical protein